MTYRCLARLALAGTLLACVVAQHAEARATATVIFADPAGDAGSVLAKTPLPGSADAGLDIVQGTIERRQADLVFTVRMSAMPPTGPAPEVARLIWNFKVQGHEFRVSAKSVDIGQPDLAAGTGTERVGKVWTSGQFRLETCRMDAPAPAVQLFNCTTVRELSGAIDVSAKTVTWRVPLAAVGAVPGVVLTSGVGGTSELGCAVCWVDHVAERSHTPTGEFDAAGGPFAPFRIPVA
jgi:hypothetical protein